jgi:integrase
VRWDLIKRDIGAGLVTPKVPRARYKTYSRSELEDILLPTLKKYKHGLVLRLIAVCGLRSEEVAALTKLDLNLRKGTIKISQAADMIGREVKESGKTKEKASVRIIDIDPETLTMLTEHVAKQHKAKVASLNNLVFPADDGRTLAYRNLERTLARACRACGLPYISPHKLRHGVAQIMDDEGSSATRIAEMLGHADGTVSEQLYTLSQRHGKSILK